MLETNLKKGEQIFIGGKITVTVTDICTDSARVRVDAPIEVPLRMEEEVDIGYSTMPREFTPDPWPIGDAEHFVRHGIQAVDMANRFAPDMPMAAQAALALALDKLRKALALFAGTPPVVDPNGETRMEKTEATRKTKKLCQDCYNNFYNQTREPDGCWSFANAKVVNRMRVGIRQNPPYHWQPEVCLSCYRLDGAEMIDRNDPRVVESVEADHAPS